jgi:hypothetical protein
VNEQKVTAPAPPLAWASPRQSPGLRDLAKALALAQSRFPTVKKARTAEVESGDGYLRTYAYADLADLLEAVRGPLAENGLSLLQPITWDGRCPWLVTRLLHVSGQWIESAYRLTAFDQPQHMGSAITYARRYAAAALLGIAAEEDDDGQAAERMAARRGRPRAEEGSEAPQDPRRPRNPSSPATAPAPAQPAKAAEPKKLMLPGEGSPAWEDPLALGAECLRLRDGNRERAADLIAKVNNGTRVVAGMKPAEVRVAWSRLADVMAAAEETR